MEGLERHALMKRDLSALKNIWRGDFTLDDPQNEIVTDENPIPFYVSLGRMVENFYHADNAVYTSGSEFFQKLNTSGKVEDRSEWKFFHTWTRAHGVWKLSIKSHK